MQLNWHVYVATHARACLRSVTTTVKEAMLLASNLGLKTSKACGRLEGVKCCLLHHPKIQRGLGYEVTLLDRTSEIKASTGSADPF